MFRMDKALRRKAAMAILLVVIFAGVWKLWLGRMIYGDPSFKPTYDGPSSGLAQTEVVGLLDQLIPAGKNIVWCASLQTAWKALENDLAREPVKLEGGPQLASALNSAWDPTPEIPEGCVYSAAGWVQKGILSEIEKEFAKTFPGQQPPSFPGIAENSFVAYSCLNARIKFRIPYFQNREPLEFTDSAGRKMKINSFGIRGKDRYAYQSLRKQAMAYAVSDRDHGGLRNEFAIDLYADSSPSQIVVARISRPRSLDEGIRRVEKGISAGEGCGLGITDVLLVPDMAWSITHRYADLEGRRLLNQRLNGQSLDVAQQDISFRLDRSGAEVMSQMKMFCQPAAVDYIMDRPFLIYMKKRGAEYPYFAMWVDNADLLRTWQE